MNERLRSLCLGVLPSLMLLATAGTAVADGSAETATAQMAPFSLEELQWRHRVLVLSAPGPDEAALRQQLAAVQASRAQFEERDLLLVVLLDRAGSVPGDRSLAGKEVARVRAALGVEGGAFALRLIGKDGGVKLARNAVVPMDEIYALIDTMPMRRSEMER